MAEERRRERALEWIRVLSAEPDRFAGGLGEQRSADRVGDWMGELGLSEVQIAEVCSRPRAGLALALHAGLAALGVWLGGFVGALCAGVAAWSFRREGRSGRARLSRLLPAAPSVNVIGRAGPAAPARRVVLSAHIDAAQAGAIFHPALTDRFARRGTERAGAGASPRGPLALPIALMWAAAATALAGGLGAEGALFALLSAGVGLALAVTAALGIEWARARPSPGANDNASGVAAMLSCAAQLLARLPDGSELVVVGTGAEEVGCCGMHALLDAHPEWERDRTFFVNFESVGGGRLHYVESEGTLDRTHFPALLLELARRLAEGGGFGSVTPTRLLAGTDAHVPADRGYPALSLISLEANGVPRSYHRPEDLPEGLDVDGVLRAADFGAALVRALLGGEAAPIHRA